MMNSIEQLARYSYSHVEMTQGSVITIVISAIFLIIAVILAQIFLGLTIYYDAKSKGNCNAGMWGGLTGVFGLIPAIIYLCVRNSASQRIIQCATCGFAILENASGCPNCNHPNPFAQQFYGPFVELSKKRAKDFLIAAICCFAVLILLIIIIVVAAFVGHSYYYY